MPKIIDYSRYIGKSFNSFILISDLGFKSSGKQLNRIFLVKCILCDQLKEMSLYEIKSGRIKSCGCIPPGTKHNKCYTSLYRIYRGMKTRCYDINSIPYKNYGQRGIIICTEWINNFMSFYNWAVQHGYKKGLEIERINNDGNYEPSNCTWITAAAQTLNRRTNRYLEYNGERLTISQWSKRLGLDRHGVSARLRHVWTLERALTTKSRYLKDEPICSL